ncbi:S26 family signal peptidase [Catenuloplanes japonicus]|uniref:S26 family signal peptidase n=1 Tax=Catenuloplanes japonicus TaxID=33876 RepID=UPI0006906F08|nr:S26 family signal peptidase [Catenuloplanes japonicus]
MGLRIVIVDGPSMEPALRDGDRVLVRRDRRPRRGEIVLVAAPGQPMDWIIKRVAGLAGDPAPAGGVVPAGMLALLGDNAAASVDSRDFGCVPVAQVWGTVVRPLRPAPRTARRSRSAGHAPG